MAGPAIAVCSPRQAEDAFWTTLRLVQVAAVAPRTRHRVRRLKAVASSVHSAATFCKPRSRNLWACCCSLMMPKTGSTSCILCL